MPSHCRSKRKSHRPSRRGRTRKDDRRSSSGKGQGGRHLSRTRQMKERGRIKKGPMSLYRSTPGDDDEEVKRFLAKRRPDDDDDEEVARFLAKRRRLEHPIFQRREQEANYELQDNSGRISGEVKQFNSQSNRVVYMSISDPSNLRANIIQVSKNRPLYDYITLVIKPDGVATSEIDSGSDSGIERINIGQIKRILPHRKDQNEIVSRLILDIAAYRTRERQRRTEQQS